MVDGIDICVSAGSGNWYNIVICSDSGRIYQTDEQQVILYITILYKY